MVYFITGQKEQMFEYYDPSFGRIMEVGGSRNSYSRSTGVDCWGISAGAFHNSAYTNAGITHQAARGVANIRLDDGQDDSFMIGYGDTNAARVVPYMYKIAQDRAHNFLNQENINIKQINEYCNDNNIHFFLRQEVLFQACKKFPEVNFSKTIKSLACSMAVVVCQKCDLNNTYVVEGQYYPKDYTETKLESHRDFDKQFDREFKKLTTKTPFSSVKTSVNKLFKKLQEHSNSKNK